VNGYATHTTGTVTITGTYPSSTTVASLSLPAGSYILSASVYLAASATGSVECDMFSPSGSFVSGGADTLFYDTGASAADGTIAFTGGGSTSTTGAFKVTCYQIESIGAQALVADVTAVPVNSLAS
jgi:hypothetical protein